MRMPLNRQARNTGGFTRVLHAYRWYWRWWNITDHDRCRTGERFAPRHVCCYRSAKRKRLNELLAPSLLTVTYR